MSPARTSRLPAIRYRPARRTDVETLAQMGMRAWRISSLEKRREFYTDHPRFGLRDVRVGELDGQIVTTLVLYPLTAHVRGQTVPITGIGSVAVSPEHRQRGIGEALMRAALREMRSRGNAIAALYAFRGSYYRKLGFGTAEIVHTMSLSPDNLPSSHEARRVRPLMLPDRPAVQALYERVAAQGHFALVRDADWWNRRLWTYPGDWVVYEGRRRGQIEGYLYYEIDASGGPFRLEMTVNEFVATTPEAHLGLTGYLRSLADQVKEVHLAVPSDNAWLTLLKSSQNLRPGIEIGLFADTGNVANGLMLRFNDVRLALETLPIAPNARGEVVLEVEDAVIPQNARSYRLTAREGKLRVRAETGRSRKRWPRVEVSADMLGPLMAGTIAPVRAHEVGLIGSAHGGADAIARWFRTRPAFLYRLNAF